MNKWLKSAVFTASLFDLVACSQGPQSADPDFVPHNTQRTFDGINSPVVLVDEAHHNFLTASGRYRPFAQVLESDGFTVRENKLAFSAQSLSNANVVVVANALDRDRTDWKPPYGNAFEADEVQTLTEWVSQGGALLLIADHTPFPKVIESLAAAFSIEFSNGHVNDASFSKFNQSLAQHPITKGNPNALFSRQVTKVKTFGGSAFKLSEEGVSLLTLKDGYVSLEPDIPFQVTRESVRNPVGGWSQGAVIEYGQGRVAIFAEGMMFSSQYDAQTNKKYGLRSSGAEHNEHFLLNVMHWLVGEL
ncbi:MAG: DUF4350 domain-containing protein [Alteromonadaceae bacterium]|nr:DUF4350 domain-containing protein [Alteromonadaceae bacterium]